VASLLQSVLKTEVIDINAKYEIHQVTVNYITDIAFQSLYGNFLNILGESHCSPDDLVL